MFKMQALIIILTFFSTVTNATPLRRQAPDPYAPVPGSCPSTPLVRAANSVSTAEASYISSRYAKASTALAAFLASTGVTFNASSYPMLALTTSGGGLRSLLTGAGVIQAFDARDIHTRFNNGLDGVYQSLTYETGLSGGGWLLSSLAGNNYPTVSSLSNNLWQNAFENTLFVPENLFAAPAAYAAISADVAAKSVAGFAPTLTDPYGRLLGYQLLYGTDGGVQTTLSGLTSLSNFTSHNAPYPILTSIGVNTAQGQCLPPANAPQYELHPYEFGSWDNGIAAFTPTHYLGTRVTDGHTNGTCYTRYDNLGYVTGTTSNVFNAICAPIPPINATSPTFTALEQDLAALVNQVHSPGLREEYATYPNPFFSRPSSPSVSSQPELSLVDGSESGQNNPIWPLLHRPLVDIIIVNDNSADLPTNYPNGSQLYNTYLAARAAGLTRMPVIPDPTVFIAQEYNQFPIFFGCNTPNTATIVYIPNREYGYFSGQDTFQLQYNATETMNTITNGVEIALRGGDPDWPLCLACGFMKKKTVGGVLPVQCMNCFEQYCYN